MKKRRLLLLTAILIIIILSVKYAKLTIESEKQQNDADMALKSSLNLAMSSFAIDFDKTPGENQKQYYYNEAMSNTYSSSQLVRFTTYDSKNDSLDVALYNLYKLMEQSEFKDKIIKRSKLIYDNISRLSQNPLDKEATDNIIKLTEEIRQEK